MSYNEKETLCSGGSRSGQYLGVNYHKGGCQNAFLNIREITKQDVEVEN